jgi:hypothetical protein
MRYRAVHVFYRSSACVVVGDLTTVYATVFDIVLYEQHNRLIMSLTAAAQAGTPLAPLPASYVESFKATLQAEGGDKSLQVRTAKNSTSMS